MVAVGTIMYRDVDLPLLTLLCAILRVPSYYVKGVMQQLTGSKTISRTISLPAGKMGMQQL